MNSSASRCFAAFRCAKRIGIPKPPKPFRLPPHTLRQRRALSISACEPSSTEPTGAPKPYDRHMDTVSKWRVISVTGTLQATTALNRKEWGQVHLTKNGVRYI